MSVPAYLRPCGKVREARVRRAILRDLDGAAIGLRFPNIARGHDRDDASLVLEQLIREGKVERRVDLYMRVP